MKKLVTKFQEKLEISRSNARTRVTFYLFFTLCMLATIAIAVFIFPYRNQGPTTWTVLYPGHYEVVMGITAQGVKMNEDQFNKILTADDTIFVSVMNTGNATFLVNKKGTNFFYEKEVVRWSFGYKVIKTEVENGILIIQKERDTTFLVWVRI